VHQHRTALNAALAVAQVMGMSPDPGFAPAALSRFAPAHVPAFRQQVWTPHGQMIDNA
jgi:hypothetical protein